jgi:RimJ/RimL family protein N-acetyltransferase
MQFQSILNDGAVFLRPPNLEDLPEMTKAVLESVSDISPWMSWAHDGYSEQQAHEYIQTCQLGWEQDNFYPFTIAAVQDGAYLGGCTLNHIDRSFRLCNLAYWVRTSRRGQGIAARASRLAARFAFEQLELLRVEIVVAVGNQASLRVAEKAGARREGVLRNRLILRENVQAAVMHSLIPQDFDAYL